MNENSDDVTSRLRHSLDGRSAAPQLGAELITGASDRVAPRLTATRRQRLQRAGGVTVAIAAVTAGALLVTTPMQHEPLFTAAGSSSGSALGASADEATSATRLAYWTNYEYTAGEGLSTDTGSGTVYQLTRPGTAVDRAGEIASAFSLAGEATKSQYFDVEYPTYVVGSEDGTAPSVAVSWVGTGSWWFNNPAAYPIATCEDAPASDGDDALIDPFCDRGPVASSENLAPSESEARALARDIFAATGLTVAADDIRISADEWQTTATANLVVAGVATALDWSISWAPSGEIAWAYGQTVTVVERGNYDTVSAHDAVSRIADGRWFGAAGPDFQAGFYALAAESGLAGDDTVASEEPTEPAAPSTDPAEEPEAPVVEPEPGIEPEPVPSDEPAPLPELPVEPETVNVTVSTAEPTLLMLWDSEGNAWLVPGFAMPHPEGWWNAIVSLVEGVIELPEPVQIDTYLVDEPVVD